MKANSFSQNVSKKNKNCCMWCKKANCIRNCIQFMFCVTVLYNSSNQQMLLLQLQINCGILSKRTSYDTVYQCFISIVVNSIDKAFPRHKMLTMITFINMGMLTTNLSFSLGCISPEKQTQEQECQSKFRFIPL